MKAQFGDTGGSSSGGGFDVGEAANYAQLASMAQGLFKKDKTSAMERRMNRPIQTPQEAAAEARKYSGG